MKKAEKRAKKRAKVTKKVAHKLALRYVRTITNLGDMYEAYCRRRGVQS